MIILNVRQKNNGKKFLTFFAFFLLAVLPLFSCGKRDPVTYTRVGDHYEITAYDNENGDAVIELPEVHDGLPVTAISDGVFARNKIVREIVIPDSITSIGARAFMNCTALETIRLPGFLTEISTQLFDGCTSLTEITLPNGITKIGAYAFDSCSSLSDIHLPKELTSIGDESFKNSLIDLTDLELPESLNDIGKYEYESYIFTVKDGLADAAFLGTSDSLTVPESFCGFPVATVSIGNLYCDGVTGFYIPQDIVLENKLMSWQKYDGGYSCESNINVLDCCSMLSFPERMPDSLENAIKLDENTRLPEWNRILPIYIYENSSNIENPKTCTSRVDGYLFSQLPSELRSESGTDADCLIISTFRYAGLNENLIFAGSDVVTSVYLYFANGELYEIYHRRSSPAVGDRAGKTGNTMSSEQIWKEIGPLFNP